MPIIEKQEDGGRERRKEGGERRGIGRRGGGEKGERFGMCF